MVVFDEIYPSIHVYFLPYTEHTSEDIIVLLIQKSASFSPKMSLTPVEFQLDQLTKLRELAGMMGWAIDSPDYKRHLTLIKKSTCAHARTLSAGGGRRGAVKNSTDAPATPHETDAVGRWGLADGDNGRGRKFTSHTDARTLLGDPPYRPWVLDRRAPGGVFDRRYISIEANGIGFLRRRIVQLKGHHRCDPTHPTPMRYSARTPETHHPPSPLPRGRLKEIRSTRGVRTRRGGGGRRRR